MEKNSISVQNDQSLTGKEQWSKPAINLIDIKDETLLNLDPTKPHFLAAS